MICLARMVGGVILAVGGRKLILRTGEELQVLRTGCFKYFERGGECINGPVSLLSGCVACGSPPVLY